MATFFLLAASAAVCNCETCNSADGAKHLSHFAAAVAPRKRLGSGCEVLSKSAAVFSVCSDVYQAANFVDDYLAQNAN